MSDTRPALRPPALHPPLLLKGALSLRYFVNLMFSLRPHFAAVAELLSSEGNLCLEDLQDINCALTDPVCCETAENIRLFCFFFFFKGQPACNSSFGLILPDHPYTSCGGCHVSEVTELFYCVKRQEKRNNKDFPSVLVP